MPGIINLTPSPSHDYKLHRDTRESLRLTTQHYVLIARQGYLIHPTISSHLSSLSNPRILEVATGTGIWATEAALLHPNASVFAYDISSTQYPPAWTHPQNLTYGILDLLADPPSHLLGKFDMLHCRLLLAAGPAVDRSIFIDRFAKLLKPGGWLQWDELSWPLNNLVVPSLGEQGYGVIDAHEYPICVAMKRYMAMDKKNGWFEEFEREIVRDGLFEEAEKIEVPVRKDLLKTETDLQVQVQTDLIRLLMKKMAFEEDTVRFLKGALERMESDRDDGMMISYRWNVGISRRT